MIKMTETTERLGLVMRELADLRKNLAIEDDEEIEEQAKDKFKKIEHEIEMLIEWIEG